MIYVTAVLMPPLAQLLLGRGVQAYACGLLLLATAGAAWPVCSMWALATVVADRRRDRRLLRTRAGVGLVLFRRL